MISEALSHAATFCEKIFVWDTGSTDSTWMRVRSHPAPQVVPWRSNEVDFNLSLRAEIFHAIKEQMAPGDWVYVLDADEFLEADLEAALVTAERQGYEQLNTAQFNFFISDRDLEKIWGGDEEPSRSVRERRRWYRFSGIEQRLFRFHRDIVWPAQVSVDKPRGYAMPLGLKRSPTLLANAHYQYRSPDQIALRHATRRGAKEANPHNFAHYKLSSEDAHWLESVLPATDLHFYELDGRFKIDLHDRWRLFRRHVGKRTFFRFDFLARCG